MNNPKDLFKSRKFILLSTMALSVLSILFRIYINAADTNPELIIVPALSMLGGPFAILGFFSVELIFLLIVEGPMPSNIIAILLMIITSLFLWKLWYTLMNKYGYELPNIGRLYNLIKILIILLIYFMTTSMLFIAFNNIGLIQGALEENTVILCSLSTLFLIFTIYWANRYKIPLYVPRKQLKAVLPKKAYSLSLILAIIISFINISIKVGQHYSSLALSVLIVLLLLVYISKPFNENVLKIKDTIDLNLFNKIYISIFLIIAITIIILIIVPVFFNVIAYEFTDDLLLNISAIFIECFSVLIIPVIIYMYILEKNVIQPINTLSESMSEKITGQEKYEEFKNSLKSIKTNNEIRSLSESLLNMEGDLISYGHELIDITSQKERFETELKLAYDIQKSMIPKDFDEISDENCEIWGVMEPAHEIGGDFYDYFQIDEENIGFVIGDVSGKGITAALIMVKAMTLIQDYAKHMADLSKVVYEVNNILCEGNVESLFVTCWIGKLNTKTGEVTFVNAGHNRPLHTQNDGFEYLSTDPGVALGAMEDMAYETETIQLNKNDAIFLYTDGATEANNDYEGFYGEERLQNILNKHKDDDLSSIIDLVKRDIDDFCDNQEAFDDITMFIIKWK